jgi:hypothetical protein
MPKLRRDTVFVAEWIDDQDSVERIRIYHTAAEAVAAADDGGDPARRDLVVVFAGFYTKRGGPILNQERQHAYFRLRGEWRQPTHYVEGDEIEASTRQQIAAVIPKEPTE